VFLVVTFVGVLLKLLDTCSLSAHLLHIYGPGLPALSTVTLLLISSLPFFVFFQRSLSARLKTVMQASFVGVMKAIWITRNKFCFDKHIPSYGGYFSSYLGVHNALIAEVMGVIFAMEVASPKAAELNFLLV